MNTSARLAKFRHSPEIALRYRETGMWIDEPIHDLVDAHAARRPEALAVVEDSRRWTYGELLDASRRAARVLLQHGVGPGSVVAVRMPNCAMLPLIHLATLRLGAVFLPLSTKLREAELEPVLRTVEATVWVVAAIDLADSRRLQAVADAVPTLRCVLWTGRAGHGFEQGLADSPVLDPETAQRLRPSPNAALHSSSTSGTTGLPKAALRSSNDLYALLVQQVGPAVKMVAGDRVAAIAPANTGTTGYVFGILGPLLHGATSIITERWSAKAALELAQRERCTKLVAIPTQLVMMLDEPVEEYDLADLAVVTSAGAPMAPNLGREVERRLGCRVQAIYGTSEGGVPTATCVDDPEEDRLTTVGRALPGEEVRVIGTDGTDVGVGEVGELVWRGPNRSYGYLNQAEADAAAWDGEGFFHSGDLGRLDERGYLRIVGRTKDMILRGGQNIFPAEIEQALIEHPSVTACALIGVPDRRLGERMCAVVVPRSSSRVLKLDDLITHLTLRGVAKFKLPEELVVVTELPLNLGGKVDKLALKQFVINTSSPTKGQV